MKMHQVAVAMGSLCGLLVVGCGGVRTKPDAYLFAQYVSAIKSAVTSNWLLPDGLPETSCKVHIEQLPGGQVVGVAVDAGCPYDERGRRSLENAVKRTWKLPYQGFEAVFRPDLTLSFSAPQCSKPEKGPNKRGRVH
jgi:hypothetical protein